jgi:hypothetical protein
MKDLPFRFSDELNSRKTLLIQIGCSNIHEHHINELIIIFLQINAKISSQLFLLLLIIGI